MRLSGLCKTIDERPILRDINLEVRAGQYVALLGANGAGKSTLLKVLALLMPPSSGVVELLGEAARSEGRAAARLRARIGLVGHQAMLYRDLSALENLVFFGRLYDVPRAEERARRLLAAVGLERRSDDPVKAFSRGMVQRVAIARALMHDPELILADEPFAGLDAPATAGLEELLAMLHGRGKTVVLVNHDIGQSLRLAQRAVVLNGGQVVMDAAAGELDAAAVLSEVSR